MRSFAPSFAVAAIAIAFTMPVALGATANRTFVKSNGLASNTGASPPCNLQAPCDTFATALSVTNSSGEINCVDSGNGGYGPLTITQSVTIDCGGQLGAIDVTANFANGITINSPSAVVKLRNLTINGNGHGSSIGINISNAAEVVIENCVIQNFGSAAISAVTSNSSQLAVADALIANNGFGVSIQNTGSGTIDFLVDRVRIVQNNKGGVQGISAFSSNGGTLTGTVRDSVVTGFGNAGILADAAGGPVTVSLDHTHVTNNLFGVASLAGAAVILNNSTIQVNNTGLSTSNGGAIFSYGNNAINGNQPNGSATPILIGLH
jgi:hypothetical protein